MPKPAQRTIPDEAENAKHHRNDWPDPSGQDRRCRGPGEEFPRLQLRTLRVAEDRERLAEFDIGPQLRDAFLAQPDRRPRRPGLAASRQVCPVRSGVWASHKVLIKRSAAEEIEVARIGVGRVGIAVAGGPAAGPLVIEPIKPASVIPGSTTALGPVPGRVLRCQTTAATNAIKAQTQRK